MISILINSDKSIDKNIQLSFSGLPYDELNNVKEAFKKEFINNYLKFNDDQKSSDKNIIELITKNLKYVLKNNIQKKPEIQVHLIRK